jgi:hypothetical protein
MKHLYYAVARLRDPTDFLYLTVLVHYDGKPHAFALPSGKEGFLDTVHYRFKPLTFPEFESYIAFGVMEVRDSDTFVVLQRDIDGFRAGI